VIQIEQSEDLPTASTIHRSPENNDLIYSSFVLHDTGLSPIGTNLIMTSFTPART